MSALRTVLAAPVSIKTSGTVTVVPRWVSTAVTNASSPRSINGTDSTDPHPVSLFDIELEVRGVDEAELSVGVLAMKLTAALHGRPAVGAHVENGDPVEDPSAADGTGLECFDHEPLFGIRSAHFWPAHATTLPARLAPGQLFDASGASTRLGY
jgi:hypothetical protein